jgi:hypothetical protein
MLPQHLQMRLSLELPSHEELRSLIYFKMRQFLTNIGTNSFEGFRCPGMWFDTCFGHHQEIGPSVVTVAKERRQ